MAPNSVIMIKYEMPKDVRTYVLLVQAEMKAQKGNGKISQQFIISHIIREYKKFKKAMPVV